MALTKTELEQFITGELEVTCDNPDVEKITFASFNPDSKNYPLVCWFYYSSGTVKPSAFTKKGYFYEGIESSRNNLFPKQKEKWVVEYEQKDGNRYIDEDIYPKQPKREDWEAFYPRNKFIKAHKLNN